MGKHSKTTQLALRILLGVTVGLAACGDKSTAGDDGGTGPDAQVGDPVITVTVQAPGGGTEAGVVTFGQAFRPGDIPDSVVVEIDGQTVSTQLDAKRRHPDGSLRHGVVSVSLPAVEDAGSLMLTLRPTDAAAGTGLTVTEVLSGGLNATLVVTEGGEDWTASVADLLNTGTVERWLDGDLVTYLRVQGPLGGAGGDHPALWVLLDVRSVGADAATLSFTVENAFHDTPGDRTYDVSILDEGFNTVFQRWDINHYHHARWRHTHHFGPAPDAWQVQHDLTYLADVGVIPRYDPDLAIPQATLDSQWQTWRSSNRDPLGNGIVIEYFPTTGGRGDIGPLPRWTALALVSGDASAMAVVQGVGDLAGSFSVHYRDRTTGRAISIDDYPTITLNSSAAQWSDPADQLPDCDPCSSPYTVDAAHQPSLAFVPYLLTGDPYYLDELYFWVSYNFIQQNFDYRDEDLGLLESQQVRAQAWTLRTLVHTAWIAPDGDPELASLEAKVANNLDWYNTNAVGSNPLGWWGKQSNWNTDGGRPDDNMDADVRYYTSPWQSDFLVWAFDLAADLGWGHAATVRDWLAGFTVGRFTNDPDFNPYDGAPYHLAVESISGAPYDDWSTVWQMSFAGRTDPAPTSMPTASCALCYPAIARVALGAALHGDLPDAQTAFDLVDTSLQPHAAEYDEDPTWAIVP